MNLDRKLFGQITISGKSSTLGKNNLPELLLRVTETCRHHKSQNGRIQIIIEINETGNFDSETSELKRLENEFLSMINSPDEEAYPGVTYARVAEVFDSDEYKAYALLAQNPDKRVGVTKSEIEQIFNDYRHKFPDCAVHFPGWVEQ